MPVFIRDETTYSTLVLLSGAVSCYDSQRVPDVTVNSDKVQQPHAKSAQTVVSRFSGFSPSLQKYPLNRDSQSTKYNCSCGMI